MKQNNYLLTGSNGFLGSVIRRSLQQQGYRVITVGRQQDDIITDITTPFSLPRGLGVDVVVHAAGKAHVVPSSEEEAMAFYHVNFEGTRHLCEALVATENLPSAFVFISTVAVYGLESGNGITEAATLNGSTPYARSKVMAEQWLQTWAMRYGIILSILRLPLIAGTNPPGNLGAMIAGIRKGYYFNIAGGKARKSMVLAEDVAMVIPKAAITGGTYNLTDGYHPSFAELGVMIADKLKRKRPLNLPGFIVKPMAMVGDLLGKRAPVNSDKLSKITADLTFDDEAARSKLGWKPQAVLQGLEI